MIYKIDRYSANCDVCGVGFGNEEPFDTLNETLKWNNWLILSKYGTTICPDCYSLDTNGDIVVKEVKYV